MRSIFGRRFTLNYRLPFLIVALAALVALVLLVRARSTDARPIHTMEADYPIYETVGQLVNKSPLIVLGTVGQVGPVKRVTPDSAPLDQLPPFKAESLGYLNTDVTIKVHRVFAGSATLVGNDLIVIHHGGDDGKQKYVMPEEPMAQRGQQYIFLLRPAPDGRYVIVGGGAQGRYLVNQGKLAAVTEGVKQSPTGRQLDGMDLATFGVEVERVRVTKP